MADIRLPDEPRAWETQVAFLRPIPPEDEQQYLIVDSEAVENQ